MLVKHFEVTNASDLIHMFYLGTMFTVINFVRGKGEFIKI